MEIRVYKAQRNRIDDPPVENLCIIAEEEYPNGLTLAEHTRTRQADAEKIFTALFKTLPGGTLDALYWMMSIRNASELTVKHKSFQKYDNSWLGILGLLFMFGVGILIGCLIARR